MQTRKNMEKEVHTYINAAWNDLDYALEQMEKISLNEKGLEIRDHLRDILDYLEPLFLEQVNMSN